MAAPPTMVSRPANRARYLRFKADEAAQAITGPYRQTHPEDNNERQSVHEHVSVALGPAPAKKSMATSAGAKTAQNGTRRDANRATAHGMQTSGKD